MFFSVADGHSTKHNIITEHKHTCRGAHRALLRPAPREESRHAERNMGDGIKSPSKPNVIKLYTVYYCEYWEQKFWFIR